jgi:hypothetical protein
MNGIRMERDEDLAATAFLYSHRLSTMEASATIVSVLINEFFFQIYRSRVICVNHRTLILTVR